MRLNNGDGVRGECDYLIAFVSVCRDGVNDWNYAGIKFWNKATQRGWQRVKQS